MSSTQFSMVEELASLVKDNLPSKHLLLSVEEMLVNFLEDHTSSIDGVLVLKPMNPYDRLLVHRLSDIFGFSHQSVGEGEDRHLVLERCPETSMPPILVNDFLQFDEMQSPMIIEEPRWKEIMPGQRNNAGSKSSLEERESSYLAARERIFSADASEKKPIKERPKHDPVVARRMITHALGQSISIQATKHESSSSDTKENARTKDLKTRCVNKRGSDERPGPCTTTKVEGFSRSSKLTNSASKGPEPKNVVTQTRGSEENYLRKEHIGAAKRLFANALGVHPRDLNHSKCDETKKSSPLVTDGSS